MYKNLFLVIALLTLTLLTACSPTSSNAPIPPDQLLLQYFAYIESGQFEDMYMMLTERSQASISKEDFIERNRNIYVGIGVQNIIITIIQMYENDPDTGQKIVEYNLHMDTVAGEISHENRNAIFDLNEDNEYRMHWSSRMIFPELGENYRVRVNTLQAARGRIIDRNGITLAGPGYASAVGFVPGRMQTEAAADLEADIAKVAELLEMTVEAVDRRLNASYVRDDTFVLLRTIARDDQDLIDELLTVQGIMISNTPVRYYPLGRKGAHLTGYVQNINAEELEERIREGYHMNSIIGRAGLESILEHPLRARDGIEIFIVDSEGNRSTTLAEKSAFDGRDIRLTIDFHIQSQLYDLFAEDKSASVAMNPITGEILALVSTPSYDPNDFVRGMTMNTWTALNEDENLPLFNRFRATFSPGSTMKAITAAIGINTGSFRPDEDFGPSGRRWQRNESWGGFFVTTVREYSGPANLNNAMAFSDNIYFAKAALRIGAETFTDELSRFGFGERIPFEYGLFSSTISTSGTITSEIQLADSGYGQGQILMNPVHMAAIYAAFVNEGNILQPRLFYDGMVYDNFAERAAPVFWIEDAFSPETARVVLDSLIHSIEVGTGQAARLPGITLAGKTGTAEIKLAQDDTTGTELGWFVLLTVDEAENPLLVVSMVEDVHGRGGSGYVVP
ncbi:MAG: penicillin-binding transpeptidase domain-containing protein, partial [Defluviitaleaceae bacterium]|nr:penicillin-binding transpeptidase domain-containing protein [Defluviitaleaceae bacterium]